MDFLLRRGSEYLAIEVKASERYQANQLKGLRAIAELPKVVRRVLIYRGSRSLRSSDGIEIWPLQRFHEMLARGTLWP